MKRALYTGLAALTMIGCSNNQAPNTTMEDLGMVTMSYQALPPNNFETKDYTVEAMPSFSNTEEGMRCDHITYVFNKKPESKLSINKLTMIDDLCDGDADSVKYRPTSFSTEDLNIWGRQAAEVLRGEYN